MLELYLFKKTISVNLGLDELFAYNACFRLIHYNVFRCQGIILMLDIIGIILFLAAHYDGKELAVLTVNCHLAMRRTAVEINNITGVKKLYTVPELMLHDTLMIHPQSIVHSMVEYCDGTVMANLSKPDMRLPIQYALSYPERTESPCEPLRLDLSHPLEFYPADPERFRAIRMAYDALRADGIMPTVYNGANERAAELYFAGRIGFSDIEDCVEAALNAIENRPADSIETIAAADTAARYAVDRFVGQQKR